MKKTCLLFSACILMCVMSQYLYAQSAIIKPDSSLSIYRAAAPKINDLLNTKLSVSFDYQKHYLYGEELVTLRPHESSVNELQLDAKGMDIKVVSLLAGGKSIPLKFQLSG